MIIGVRGASEAELHGTVFGSGRCLVCSLQVEAAILEPDVPAAFWQQARARRRLVLQFILLPLRPSWPSGPSPIQSA